MDFAIAQGMQGLYQSQSLNERNKEQMANLKSMYDVFQAEQKDQEAASIRYNQYQEQVSKFSDTLLAPDRTRINKKANLLSEKMRNEMISTGGDMRKFLSNGGHQVMNDYKNGIINSEEAGNYLENKKNSDLIINAMGSGKGHLINMTDLAKFQKYGETGEGKIGFSGLYNEIKMPDANNYIFGEKIPAKDILDSNYFNIYGNYKLTYPDAPEPSRYDLEVFTDQLYGGKGANWQFAQAKIAESNRHIEAIAKTKAELMETMFRNSGVGPDRRSGRSNRGGTGGKLDNSNNIFYDENGIEIPMSEGNKEFSDLIVGQIHDGFIQVKKGLTVEELQNGYGLPEKLMEMTTPLNTKDISAIDGNLNEVKWANLDIPQSPLTPGSMFSDISRAITGQDMFAPSGARRVLQGLQINAVEAYYAGTETKAEIDPNTKIWKGYKPSNNSFLPNGQQAIDNDSPIKYDTYAKQDFQVKDMVTVMVGKNAKTGSQMILMDKVKRDGVTITDDSKQKQKDLFGNSELTSQIAVVMQNDKGTVFYELIDPSNTQAMNKMGVNMGAAGVRTDFRKDVNNRETRADYNKINNQILDKEAKDGWNSFANDQDIFKNAVKDSMIISGSDSYTGAYVSFIKGFYGAYAQLQNDFSKNGIKNITSNPGMNIQLDIREFDQAGFTMNGKNLTQTLKEGKESSSDILAGLYDWAAKNKPEDLEMIALWIRNEKHLN